MKATTQDREQANLTPESSNYEQMEHEAHNGKSKAVRPAFLVDLIYDCFCVLRSLKLVRGSR